MKATIQDRKQSTTPICNYYAWLWRTVNDDEPACRNFTSLESAHVWLAKWIAEWPEAEEYGIDHNDDEGNPVADFLSEAIKRRIGENKEEFEQRN